MRRLSSQNLVRCKKIAPTTDVALKDGFFEESVAPGKESGKVGG